MTSSKGTGAAHPQSGRTPSSHSCARGFAQLLPQGSKGNTRGECLPHSSSETDTPEENYSWQIPIHQKAFEILKNNESQLCEVLQHKFGCISTLVSPAVEVNSTSLQVFRKRLSPRLELSVWKDDLTTHAVHAVVNAANEELTHAGGLAGALVKAGGFEIQQESWNFVAKYGKVPTGEIAITGSGKLPCKQLIHAVGPRWTPGEERSCVDKLQNAIVAILHYVTWRNPYIETVAIPALSSGIFQFPLDLCVGTIVNTISTYFQREQVVSSLREIHLVSNEDPTVDAFKAASESILGRNELDLGSSREASASHRTLLVFQNLILEIVQGRIELQETDVIVSSISQVNHTAGPVLKSILQQAGDEMELELEKQAKQRRDSQLVLITEGFNLLCLNVFHVLWDPTLPKCQVLKDAVKTCLEKCLVLRKSSISFPALGTGNTGMAKATVAEIMFDEVLTFARGRLKKPLTVKFVIFPDEMETYKVFRAEMEKKSKMLGLNNYRDSRGTREKQRENGLEAKSPAIDLMGSNKEQMSEAQAWLQRLLALPDHQTIENNHIFYLGKKEHDILAQLQKDLGISICEIISPGRACLEIQGAQAGLIEGVMNIERVLCQVQEEMAQRKEQALWSLWGQWAGQQPNIQKEMKENITFLRHPMPLSQDQRKEFEKCGLRVLKVEKIANAVLMAAFQRKKEMMEERKHKGPVSHRLFQQVPNQFCDVICRVGFHRMYSMPSDPRYGAGIYFTKKLKNLADKIKSTPVKDKLIYIFEAEVLTGSFCEGHRSNIVPSPLYPGTIDNHDSVVDSVSNPEIFVIFSGIQAMPLYLWTCTQDYVRSQDYSSGPMVSSSQQPWEKFPSGSSVD
ncbi:protein mono-ADP-ribosyltransferase PARP9 isoform X1 [Oryctolagus cuniculus]|uniref:Poly(ADP-ribose) polymerase family member 9 n=1 Tax=Oryctolagus cuniculus TaxID=9986 RepID=U3KMB3_RABIT|nr:protein mono-ADP-ribosyltransferase PARP9 isoform X3 [Oryctolagus cuniculus]XP_017202544.1 protein mono-ADP-ribosyltransferase PARP9 isoform X3 [Oryctolagus cuniculus]XP_051715217.1 protein mono-ADP-ribosyltransferase PARP9 isoform X3 [Oryctolagus cuniculus]